MAKYVNYAAGAMPPFNTSPVNTSLMSYVLGNKQMMIGIGAVVFFIGVALIYYFYYNPSSVKYHANHEHALEGDRQGDKTAELLFFFAEWCPHCKVAKPIWNELSEEYDNKAINGYKVTFTTVDCTQESAEVEKLMNQYSVEGYPTIKLLKDGQIVEYDAKPSKETLIKFLNTVL